MFFFLCISIGVGSIVALRSLIGNLNRAVAADARFLLTADVEVNTTTPFKPEEIAKIEEVAQKFPGIEARGQIIQTNIMTRPTAAGEGALMVEIKGVENNFPLVGEFKLSDGRAFDYALLENNGVLAAEDLLEKLAVKIGDKIRVAGGEFEIRGTFAEEPGGASGFRLGPRMFVERKVFDEIGLSNLGRARRKMLFRTADDPAELSKELRAALKGSVITVQSYREAQENFAEQFARTENYLSLTGLLILVLGGVGVWNVARVFIEQKRQSIAVLKCLGAGVWRVTSVYLLQILTLGFVGSIFGVGLAQLALWGIRARFADSLPPAMSYQLNASSIWQGLLLGVSVSLLFSSLPLLQIGSVKPRLLLRDENNYQLRHLGRGKWLLGILVIAGMLLLAVWQAGSWLVGFVFLVGLAATSAALFLAAALLTKVLSKLKDFGSFPIRQSINSLYRPGNQTRVILIAVGLGMFVVIAVQSLQSNLVREFDFSRNDNLPSLFMIDIHKSQRDDFQRHLTEATGRSPDLVPTLRGRIAAVDGKPVDLEQREIRQQTGQLGREYVLSYRPQLGPGEKIIAGKFWDERPAASDTEAEVSIEDGVRGLMGMDVGSVVTFDILGRRLSARVTSVRKFDLRQTRTAFMFVFRPGVLESAPQTYVSPITAKLPASDRAKVQRSVLEKFPNVSTIDVADVVANIQKLLGNFVLAISFVGLFVMLSGLLILLGSIALTKSQRIYENAILKTLGAKMPTLTAILFAEYGLLGLLSGLIGSFFGLTLSWAMTVYVFKLNWEIEPVSLALFLIAETLIVMLVGALGSFDVLFKKPLNTLRSQ